MTNNPSGGCGCKIVAYEHDYPDDNENYIEYCPLHASALELREALIKALEVLFGWQNVVPFPHKQNPYYVIGTNEAIENGTKVLNKTLSAHDHAPHLKG